MEKWKKDVWTIAKIAIAIHDLKFVYSDTNILVDWIKFKTRFKSYSFAVDFLSAAMG